MPPFKPGRPAQWVHGLGLAFLGLLLPTTARACTCEYGHFLMIPAPGSSLPVESQLLIEGYGEWSKRLGSLGEAGLMLVSGPDRVPLRVAKVYQGDNRASAVLSPTLRLKNGRSYALVVEPPGKKKERIPLKFNDKPIEWNTVLTLPESRSALNQGPGSAAPLLAWWLLDPSIVTPISSIPTLSEVQSSSGECVGTSVSVRLRLDGDSGGLVFVSIAELRNGAPFPMRVIDQSIELTHDACGGPFELMPEQKYTFEIYAAARDFSPVKSVKSVIEVSVPPVGKTVTVHSLGVPDSQSRPVDGRTGAGQEEGRRGEQ